MNISLQEKLSSELRLSPEFVKKVANMSRNLYKKYYIPKRKGGSRLIHHPAPELKTLQYWIKVNVIDLLPISKASSAYTIGKSIKDHAEFHLDSSHFLHVDIKGFFEHITYEHLKSVLDQNVSLLKNHGYILSDDDFLFIKKICFIGDHLVMGSVVSPSISNVIMFNFDQCIIEDIEKSNMRYTRYADDIYISSKTHISNSVLAEVISELSKMGFEINRDKTSFFSILSRPLITGVLIRQDREISLGLSYRKMIKGLVYKKLRYGEGDSRKILGYLSYLRFMEPITYNRILLKYSYFGNVLKLLKKDIIKEV